MTPGLASSARAVTEGAGETARIKIATRMAGRALIGVLGSGLASMQEVDLPAGGREVPFRVSDDWSPGAYVTVMLYRPMDERAKRMPSRALGLRWLAVDQAPRMLNVRLEAPDKVKSGAMLTVPVKVAGLAAGERVVTDGQLRLTAGVSVTVREPDAPHRERSGSQGDAGKIDKDGPGPAARDTPSSRPGPERGRT